MEEETRRVFEIFIEQAERLRAYHFQDHVQEVGLAVSITRREDGHYDTVINLPEDKERDAFLLVFRMFYQQNDEISVLNLNRFHQDQGVSAAWRSGYAKIRKLYLSYLRERPDTIEDNVFEGSPDRNDMLPTS